MSAPITERSLDQPKREATGTQRLRNAVAGGGDVALAAARVGGITLTAASAAVVARSLGPHSYGVFAAGTAVATLVVVGKTFGADALYLRGSIDSRALMRRCLGAAGVNLVAALVAGLLWPGLSWTARGCEMFMGSGWAVSYARLPWQILPGRDLRFAVRAWRELISNALLLVGVMLLAGIWHQPLLASAGLLLGALASVVISLPSLRTERSGADPSVANASVRSGLVFTAVDATFLAYFLLDGAMIAAMRPPVDAGMYRVAYAFVLAAAVVPIALNADVLRVRLWQLDAAERRRALRRAIALTTAAGIGVTVAFELLGGTGERLFFGTKFAAAVPIIRLLGIAMPFHYANSVMSNVLVAANRAGTVIRVQSALVLVNLIGNLLLIPAHGTQGAAVMTAITEAVGTVILGATTAHAVRQSSWLLLRRPA